MKEKIPKINLAYIRHGEHNEKDGKSASLTSNGIDEAVEVGNHLGFNKQQTLVYSPELHRSLMTSILVVDTDINKEKLNEHLSEFLQKKKIVIDNNLVYKSPVGSKKFKEALDNAVSTNKTLEFMVLYSDEFKKEYQDQITTHKDMVNTVANYILRYIKVFNAWSKVSDKYFDKNLNRLFCSKEYIYPCFRAELTKYLIGSQEQLAYIKWYEETQESSDLARKSIAKIIISVNENNEKILKLIDNYGEISFDENIIESILSN